MCSNVNIIYSSLGRSRRRSHADSYYSTGGSTTGDCISFVNIVLHLSLAPLVRSPPTTIGDCCLFCCFSLYT